MSRTSPGAAAAAASADGRAPIDLDVVPARRAGERGRRQLGRRPRAAPRRRSSSTMLAGSSVRGLSEVTTARSASRAAISPMSGRLPRSRSPPQPNTTISRPVAAAPPAVAPPRSPARARRACARSRPRRARRARWRPARAAPGRRRSPAAPATIASAAIPRATAIPTASARFVEVVVADQRRRDLQLPDRRRERRARAVRRRRRAALDDDVGAARLGAGRPRHAERRARLRPRAHPPPGLVVDERHRDPARRIDAAARTGSPWRSTYSLHRRRDSRGGPASGWSAPPPETDNRRGAPARARARSLLTRRRSSPPRASRRAAHAA